MGLGQALSAAVSGLRVTQSSLSLVASNIANAETPGYVKKTSTQVASASGNVTIGVRLSSINRELDQYLQRQLRTETSGGTYATTRSDFFQRLQGIFGQPGGDNALATVFNGFTAAVQALSTSPDSSSARYGVLTAGANAGAAPQRHDQRHSGAAQRCRARPVGRCQSGQQRDAADRRHQPAARTDHRAGRHHGNAARSARCRDRSALAADGHQSRPDRQQSGPDLYPTGHATRRRPRRHNDVRRQGFALGDVTVGRRPDKALRRHDHARHGLGARDRHDRHQYVRLRQDRRIARHARSRAGRCAGAGRPDRVGDVARAVGPHDRGHGRGGRIAVRLRCRYRIAPVRQHDQSDLHGHGDQHAAQGHARAGRRSARAAALRQRHARDRRQGRRHRLLRRARVGHRADQCGARAGRVAGLQSGGNDAARAGFGRGRKSRASTACPPPRR